MYEVEALIVATVGKIIKCLCRYLWEWVDTLSGEQQDRPITILDIYTWFIYTGDLF